MESDPFGRDRQDSPERGFNGGSDADDADAHETGQWDPPTVERSTAKDRQDTAQFIGPQDVSSQSLAKIGKYFIRGILGMGGMGIVYRGFDPMIEREVAIKMLPNEVTHDSTALRRFLQEARAAGKVSHPNVATIYETGEHNRSYYLVMELLPGGNAAKLMRQSSNTWRRTTCLVRDCCLGLSAMHAAGLVHRDIKPGNLMLTASGQVKIGDFGLVKSDHQLWKTSITKEGEILGTPEYMSPEQTMGQPVDHRTDIYSLGATYYALLVGKAPFTGSSKQVMAAHCNAEPPDPADMNPRVPPACAYVVGKAMAKDPRNRYADADEMRADLELILEDHEKAAMQLGNKTGTWRMPAPNAAKPNRLFVVAVVGAILGGVLAAAWLAW